MRYIDDEWVCIHKCFFSDKQEFSPGIDLANADLRLAAYRTDLVHADPQFGLT
ncbi:hypothetical protein DPMN_057496 [Dreissena polymorpha]|uniref:Uncharacterized protein n=1 Tax=Dreissena polymorpha TaxID=45954 RepID=A0A9D4C071_DREPO|nr:hypothetical protein DPMN_057496 [Dreissena polymorpha]